MNKERTAHALLAGIASVALAAGCATTNSSTGLAGADEWLEPSPSLAMDIESHAQRLPWTNRLEDKVALIEWFGNVGEPAYPTLLGLVTDPRPGVAGMALASLGRTRDPRLVMHLRNVDWPVEVDPDLSLERARALLQLGDWSQMPVLIEGLRDERFYTRAVCIRTLSAETHERLGYNARAPEEEREQAVIAWEAWWGLRGDDPFLDLD